MYVCVYVYYLPGEPVHRIPGTIARKVTHTPLLGRINVEADLVDNGAGQTQTDAERRACLRKGLDDSFPPFSPGIRDNRLSIWPRGCPTIGCVVSVVLRPFVEEKEGVVDRHKRFIVNSLGLRHTTSIFQHKGHNFPSDDNLFLCSAKRQQAPQIIVPAIGVNKNSIYHCDRWY